MLNLFIVTKKVKKVYPFIVLIMIISSLFSFHWICFNSRTFLWAARKTGKRISKEEMLKMQKGEEKPKVVSLYLFYSWLQ